MVSLRAALFERWFDLPLSSTLRRGTPVVKTQTNAVYPTQRCLDCDHDRL